MIIGFVRFFFPKVAYRRVAKRHLLQHFPENPEQVWRSTLDWQLRLAPSRPRHSASVNIMIRHMEWSLALYRAAKDHGMSQTEACSLAENILSEVYQPVPATMFKLSRHRSRNHETRVKWLLGMITRYFFSAPFVHRHLESKDGVAFDVTCCPLADYFREQGAGEQTALAACNTDASLARELGVELVRTQTIAEGCEYCDFRWKFPEADSGLTQRSAKSRSPSHYDSAITN